MSGDAPRSSAPSPTSADHPAGRHRRIAGARSHGGSAVLLLSTLPTRSRAISAAIVLLGATGYTGRLVAAELQRRGHAFVAAGRDVERVAAAVQGMDAEVEHADVTDRSSLERLLADAELVLTTVGPFDRLGHGLLATAVETRTHYLDSTGEQAFIRSAHRRWHEKAAASEVTVVPAAAFDYVPGDLLASVAAATVDEPREAHVTYLVKQPLGLVGSGSAGTRRTISTILGKPVLARVDGALVEEALAGERRLAWFPRPVGPHHAAAAPGGEPLSIPRHLPDIRTVRTYIAMPTWQAEIAQLGAAVARRVPALPRALERLVGVGDGPSPRSRSSVRVACVVEVAGPGAGPEVARAWLSGVDVYAFSAVSMVLLAERVLAGRAQTGVIAPAQVDTPAGLLDELSARHEVQWSVVAPRPR